MQLPENGRKEIIWHPNIVDRLKRQFSLVFGAYSLPLEGLCLGIHRSVITGREFAVENGASTAFLACHRV